MKLQKQESLEEKNRELRTLITKLAHKLNENESEIVTDSKSKTEKHNLILYCEKLENQNQRPERTVTSMNEYIKIIKEENKATKGLDENTVIKGLALTVERYKNLYKRETKNFKRHKRKYEKQLKRLNVRNKLLCERILSSIYYT